MKGRERGRSRFRGRVGYLRCPSQLLSCSQVVLNLEDVAEERELEELEDGRCGGDEEEEESADEAIEETDSIIQPSSVPQHTNGHR